MINLKTGVILAAAVVTVIALTACGSSSSISSLTDSDTTASTPADNKTQSNTSSVQEVPASALTIDAGKNVYPKVAESGGPASGAETAENAVEGIVPTLVDDEEFVPAGEGNTGKTNTDLVNFRTEPDTSTDNVIDELPLGTEVVVLEAFDDWFKVKVDDTEGYVKQEYIS